MKDPEMCTGRWERAMKFANSDLPLAKVGLCEG